MRLPTQVQALEERANKAIEDYVKARGDGNPLPPEGEPAKDEATNSNADTPPVVDQAPPQSEPAQEGQPDSAKDRTDWKAKYHTLQGMFNAEVPRLRNDLKAANARIKELENLHSSVAKDGQPEPKKAALPEELESVIGKEVADKLAGYLEERERAIRSEFAPVKDRVETVAQEQHQTAQQAFLAALGEKVPDWQDIDNRDDWQQFLSQVHPEALVPRQELLVRAFRNNHVEAAAAQFNAFKKLVGIPASTPVKPDAPPAVAQPPAALQRQQTPVPSGKAATVTPEKKVWSRAEIKDIGVKIALGHFKPEVADKILADITAAGSEGRIR